MLTGAVPAPWSLEIRSAHASGIRPCGLKTGKTNVSASVPFGNHHRRSSVFSASVAADRTTADMAIGSDGSQRPIARAAGR
jgi:hypothetical protein